VSFPAERSEGIEGVKKSPEAILARTTHPRCVCGAKGFSWRADARLMGSLPLTRFAR